MITIIININFNYNYDKKDYRINQDARDSEDYSNPFF